MIVFPVNDFSDGERAFGSTRTFHQIAGSHNVQINVINTEAIDKYLDAIRRDCQK